ncbi:MAG: signal peptidase II [Lachnospiraceae bacterium]|nr:signal peptidase II [Lachnospiraceae bacterium]
MNKKRVVVSLIFLLCAAALVLLDVWTKALAVRHLLGQADIELIPGILSLHYLENTGAAFGILKGQFVVFYILTFAICVGILWYLWRLPIKKQNFLSALALLLVFAGAIGNGKDRILLHYVIDFIYFSLIDFPVFNVADIYVTVGVGLLMVSMLIAKEEDGGA